MAEPTVQEVFGPQVVQNVTELVIRKSDLVPFGLVPSDTNKAEQLVAALVLLFAVNLTEANRSADLVNRNVTVYYGGQDLTGTPQSPGGTFRRDAYSVLLYKSRALDPVTASDY